VLQLAGWLAVELLALKRGGCVAVSWLAFLFSGRAAGCTPGGARCVAASWLSCCPTEQRAVHAPSGRQQLASDDDAGDL
jgi:hypothetical protein